MKKMNSLLLAGAAVASLTLVGQVQADVFLSPRAQANQIARISGPGSGPSTVSGSYLGAGNKAASMFPTTVSGSSESRPNLVSGNYPGAAAKSPIHELRGAQFEIAPAVEKAAPQPGCCHGTPGQAK